MNPPRQMKVCDPDYIRSDTWMAWCAGVFDGEGYVGVKKGTSKCKEKKQMSCVVAQKDPRLLKKFKRIVKMGNITGPSHHGMYYWQLYKTSNILCLFEMLWPYLSPVKQIQFKNTFKLWFKYRKQHGKIRL